MDERPAPTALPSPVGRAWCLPAAQESRPAAARVRRSETKARRRPCSDTQGPLLPQLPHLLRRHEGDASSPTCLDAFLSSAPAERLPRRHPGRPKRRSGSQPRPRPSPPPPGPRLGVPSARLDDPLHELAANYILVQEANEGDTVDGSRGRPGLWLTRPEACSRGRIPFSALTSPVTTILEPNPRRVRNILHLLRARVLRFVEDDEAVVQRAPAHERQGGNPEGAFFHVPQQAGPH